MSLSEFPKARISHKDCQIGKNVLVTSHMNVPYYMHISNHLFWVKTRQTHIKLLIAVMKPFFENFHYFY